MELPPPPRAPPRGCLSCQARRCKVEVMAADKRAISVAVAGEEGRGLAPAPPLVVGALRYLYIISFNS